MTIYKTTNLMNGKIYVGQDSHDNPEYLGSGLLIKRAIKKYGKENFTKEILEECDCQDLLNEREVFWIKELNSTNLKIGYNICKGGHSGDSFTNHPNREEIRARMTEANRKRIIPPESRRRISEGASKKLKGVPLSIEHRRKLSESHIGSVASPEARLKMSIAKIGKYVGENNPSFGMKRSDESRRKMSESHIGNTHSDETKKKMSEKRKGSGTWTFGKERDDETKKKISMKLKGRKYTEEEKAILYASRRGKRNKMEVSDGIY